MRDKQESGSITFETILILPMFIIFYAALITAFAILGLKMKMQSAITNTALSLSKWGYIGAELEGGDNPQNTYQYYFYLRDHRDQGSAWTNEISYAMQAGNLTKGNGEYQAAVSMLLKKELAPEHNYYRIDKRNIVNGMDGIDVSGSTFNEDGNGKITVCVEYEYQLLSSPLLGGEGLKIPITQTASTRIW